MRSAHLDRRIATAATHITDRRHGQRDHADRALRHRRPDRRQDPGPGRGHHPLPLRRRVRLLHRHRPDRSLLRRRRPPPSFPGRGPSAELCLHVMAITQIRRDSPGGPTTGANAPPGKATKKRCAASNDGCPTSSTANCSAMPKLAAGPGGHPGAAPNSSAAAQPLHAALRTSHFPDPPAPTLQPMNTGLLTQRSAVYMRCCCCNTGSQIRCPILKFNLPLMSIGTRI